MTEWSGRGSRLATAAVMAAVLLGASRSDASTIGITNETDLQNSGPVDWGVLGSSFTSVSNPFAIGVDGLTLTASQAGGDFARIDQGPSDWNGNFGPGERLLWTFFGGPITFVSPSDMTGHPRPSFAPARSTLEK